LELPHDSNSLKGTVYFVISGKKWHNSLRLLCGFSHYFASVGNIDNTSLTCECDCVAYFAQMLKIFAQIMANFSALEMRPHPLPYAYARRLECKSRFQSNDLGRYAGETWNLRGHTRIFERAYYLRPNNASHVAVARTMCHAGTKSARPSITPSPEPQWGLTLIEPLRPYYLGSGRRSRSDGGKL